MVILPQKQHNGSDLPQTGITSSPAFISLLISWVLCAHEFTTSKINLSANKIHTAQLRSVRNKDRQLQNKKIILCIHPNNKAKVEKKY